ncbi:S1 family peptidase [Actinopolyspora halophila]|uniref:S1 family peptidase n=1 Tax=Actinopolyspora halophila TaxID=1850 RepID=UPI000362DD8B|nr:alpha-lytic protease prodomain-containing protein [Actinopolyspora halophila]
MKLRLAGRLAGTMLLATATAALTAAPVGAAPEQASTPERTSAVDQQDRAGTLLEAMQRDLGITLAQSRQRLRQESIAERVQRTVRGSLGAAYGGSYYDSAAGELVVGVTDRAKLDEARSSGARARLVEHSSAELDGIAGRLDGLLPEAPPAVTGYYVDPADNSVVLTADRGGAGAAENFLRSSGVAENAVRVDTERSPRLYNDIVGGNPYYVGDSARCSVGFAVQGGFVSAGHCARKGDGTSSPRGTTVGSSFPENDYSYIASAERGRPAINDYGGGTVSVAGSTEAPVGSSVCRSGSTTGWHCGTIVSKNQAVRYDQGTVHGLTRTDVCAEPGDSGGAFVSGDQAQGMTSGGWGNCTDGGTTFFQPVNEALDNYGVQLLTE